MSDHYDQREALFEAMKDKGQAAYDVQALRGAAEFFEQMATMGNPAPIAFAQAIRRSIPHVEMEAWVDAEMNRNMTKEEADELERRSELLRRKIEAVTSFPAPEWTADFEAGYRKGFSDTASTTFYNARRNRSLPRFSKLVKWADAVGLEIITRDKQ